MPKVSKLPKMPKVQTSELTVSYHFIVLISGLPYCRRQRLIKKTERSDSFIRQSSFVNSHFLWFRLVRVRLIVDDTLTYDHIALTVGKHSVKKLTLTYQLLYHGNNSETRPMPIPYN